MKFLKNKLYSISIVISLSLLFTLSGCGYQAIKGNSFYQGVPTISIPYVQGDVDGALTAAIIKAVTMSGSYEYRSCGGALLLKVCQFNTEELDIGFRYDRKKCGKLTRDTIPVEERIRAFATVTLIEVGSGTVIVGPEVISAAIDYDHDYYFSRNQINVTSLGQLTDLEEAYDAVQMPLYRRLAWAIAEFIQ